MNAAGHWNRTRPRGHNVCFISHNRSKTSIVDCSAGCSLTLYSIASLRLVSVNILIRITSVH